MQKPLWWQEPSSSSRRGGLNGTKERALSDFIMDFFFSIYSEEKTESLSESKEELEKYLSQCSKLRQEVRNNAACLLQEGLVNSKLSLFP